ncbi:hypothetical protein BU25DRAFT_15217 [Macroventuria anomochaeta]|uniref:Uncharacterized protein n=1 Tax=Macroventuria anomochaeta TaxID=301207 RepID=A0ACB6SIQ8_9PLEO|nr:uncharacterized protein BU25DRAFT_15217 [Macroventuria anomochaeta]KAF2633918.1 hypothetical protein BU25DRAFT_15217 [Macroventuria anomochaeta]
MAQVYQHAELPQPHLPRRRAGDAPLLRLRRHQTRSMAPLSNWHPGTSLITDWHYRACAKEQYLSYMYQDEDKAIVNRVEEVSKRFGQSIANVATAWSLKKGVNRILRLNSIERIDEVVGAVGLELSEDDVKALGEPYKARAVAPMW